MRWLSMQCLSSICWVIAIDVGVCHLNSKSPVTWTCVDEFDVAKPASLPLPDGFMGFGVPSQTPTSPTKTTKPYLVPPTIGPQHDDNNDIDAKHDNNEDEDKDAITFPVPIGPVKSKSPTPKVAAATPGGPTPPGGM
jgi:hypothetical protein